MATSRSNVLEQLATAMSSVESKQLAAAKGVPGAGNTTTIKSAVTVTAASLGFTLKKEQECSVCQWQRCIRFIAHWIWQVTVLHYFASSI